MLYITLIPVKWKEGLSMWNVKNAMLLYAITDRSWTGDRTLEEQVKEALNGGASCLQLREKNLSNEDFLNEAYIIKKICKEHEIPFIINDNVEVARACDCDGIHVGQSDADIFEVRETLGYEKKIGVSVFNVKQALEAENSGADYLGVGAVFPTATKQDASDVSHEELRKICEAVNIPVVAIGGITKENINQLAGKGIDGVALISAIFSAKNIEGECRELKSLVKRVVD